MIWGMALHFTWCKNHSFGWALWQYHFWLWWLTCSRHWTLRVLVDGILENYMTWKPAFFAKKSLGMIPENKLHVWFLRESKFLWSSLVSLVQLCASFVISVASIWVWEAYLMLEFFPDNRDLILERSVKGGLSGQLRKVKSVSCPAEWFSFELICSMRSCPDVHWWFMMIFDSFLICRCIVSLWNMS